MSHVVPGSSAVPNQNLGRQDRESTVLMKEIDEATPFFSGPFAAKNEKKQLEIFVDENGMNYKRCSLYYKSQL